MWRAKNLLIIAGSVIALLVASCSYRMVGEVKAFGRVREVSAADLETAVAVDRQKMQEEIYEIHVVNRDEIHIYHERPASPHARYVVIKRVHGTWRFVESTKAGSLPRHPLK